LTGSHPEAFQAHVRAAVDQVSSRPQQERLVWIKSWNEWAEGNHLEPDAVHGHGWLRAISEELIRGE
jgi:lipopolysaccharide biosynthesis protein